MVIAAIAIAAVVFLTSGQRDIVRNFVLASSAGDYEEARDLLHSGLQGQFPIETFEERFAGVAPYTEVSFSSVETSGAGTRLEGRAETAGDCSSALDFTVLDGRITAFNINPLCRE